MELIPGYLDVPLWAVLTAIAAVLVYIYSTWNYTVWSKQGIKGPYPLPYFGTIITTLLKGGFYHTDLDFSKKYGNFIGLYLGKVPALGTTDPEFLRKAMIKEFQHMPNRFSVNAGGMFNLFLTALKDDHWRHVRSSLTPTFTTGKLKQMMPLISQCTEPLIKHLEESGSKPFNVKDFAGCYTMDVIASTAFGIQVDSFENPDDPLLEHAREMMGSQVFKSVWQRVKFTMRMIIFFSCPGWFLKLMGYLRVPFFDVDGFKYFENLCDKIVNDRQCEKSDRRDFVQLCKEHMIEDPKPNDPDTQVDRFGEHWSTKGLTKKEIIANAVLFFLAGFETTATSLSFILYELAMNPEVQEQAFEELQRCCTSPDKPTYEELSKLEYLDRVIDETLRLYPPAARLDRIVSKDIEIDGITIPAGGAVTAMVYAMHHNPEVFPDPFKFDPERFTPENKESRHPCAYMPFGVGNRNCIGMRLALLEIKMALVTVLNKFELKCGPTTPLRPVALKKGLQLGTAQGNELIAVPRVVDGEQTGHISN